MTTVYLATVGPKGLREICEHNILKTDYAVSQIQQKAKCPVLFRGPRFNEFVIQTRKTVGLSLSRWYPELENMRLLCVTEVVSREQIDRMVRELAA
jgi:glycine dehydrogenase subunit 1